MGFLPPTKKGAQTMAYDAEVMAISSTTEPAARSAAAESMRLHRERRRRVLRYLMVELRETKIDALIRKGLLKAETSNDPGAIIEALYAHLDRTLSATP